MGLTLENGWILTLCLAAACKGDGDVATTSRLLVLAALAFTICLTSSLIHWAAPGGPAWGRFLWSKLKPRDHHLIIPGPRGLPFIGSMRLMTGLAHRKLAAAAEASDASRLMAFSVGTTRFVVTSNPDVAKQILTSAAFGDRPAKESAYGLMFHRAIGFAPYGAYWRILRRIATTHLFSPKQIAIFGSQREQIASQMIESLREKPKAELILRDILRRASLYNVMWSVFGRKYDLGQLNDEMIELKSFVEEGYYLLGKLNWSDHLPILAGLDLQGIRSRCSRLVPKVTRFVSRIIEEHRSGSAAGKATPATDFVHVLLSLEGSDKLTDSDMTAVLWEMIFRGTDTVAVLTEWALARLVLHRDVQNRVHEELDRVVGRSRAVTENDVGSLPYLQAVVKEVLRLHPPGPLLSWARLATSDVHVDGRLVPAGTTAMVNMWAITHDPHVWEAPLEFRPDRFVGGGSAAELSVMGSDLRLAPFGSGRRSCPGKPLAMATVSFWLAALMHEFEWGPAGVGARVDLTEVLGLSCEMASPLTVQLVSRRV